MLLTVQFPIADARWFASGLPRRIERPDWEYQLDIEKHFGRITQRLRGGHAFWYDERFYASARNAFRFHQLGAHTIGWTEDAGAPSLGFQPRCAFRRLFCDQSRAVVRLEVGLRDSRSPGPSAVLTPAGCAALAEQALNLDVRTANYGTTAAKSCKLRDLSSHVASLYEHATLRRPPPKNWKRFGTFVCPGRPVLLLEYDQDETTGLPPLTHERPIDPALVNGAEIAFMWHQSGGTTYPLWFLRANHPDRATVRRMRLGLLRLFLQGTVKYKRGSKGGERFDAYLQHAVRYLSKEQHDRTQLREIQDVIAAESLVGTDDLNQLEQLLQKVRRPVLKNVVDLAANRLFDGQRRARLREVLVAQFPSRSELKVLVDDALSTNLDEVAREGNLQETAAELIWWMNIDIEGRLRPLLAMAIRERPNSEEFRALQSELFGT